MEIEELDRYFDFDTIIQRMLDNVSNNVDKREGSIIYDAIAPCAAELAQMYIVLKNNMDLVFMDTAVEQYLDKLANQIGIIRKEATNCLKNASFYNEDDQLIDIPLNSRFTCDEFYWVVKEMISTGVYKVECENPGADANGSTGSLLPVDYIDGLARAELGEMLIPGEDTESDEELRARCFESINEKAFSGNIADYNKKTKEIDGVGAVKVTPIWNGGGTVKLTILDSDFNKASQTLIDLVQEIICPDQENMGLGIAPVGHAVTVDTAEETEINISTNVTITEGSDINIVKQQIEHEVNKYLLELRKEWEGTENIIVRIAQIESRILNIATVLDISDTTLNSGTGNIELQNNNIPVLSEVVVV